MSGINGLPITKTVGAALDTQVPTEKAVKTYSDAGDATVTAAAALIAGRSAGQSLVLNTTAAQQVGAQGVELLSASGWTSTDWTGDWATGWTHTVSNTTTLTNSLAAVSGSFYVIAMTITGDATNAVSVRFGNVLASSLVGSATWGICATSTGSLIITPAFAFSGTIVISIKEVSARTAVQTIKDSAAALANEIRSSTAASANLFIGLAAGQLDIYGTSCVGIGAQALGRKITGNYDTAVGVGALGYDTRGVGNTAVGCNAGAFSANPNYFDLFGYNAGGGAGNCSYSAGFGAYSLYNLNGSASYVAAMGFNAGRSLTGATNSAFFGPGAGYNASQKVDAVNQLVLGYNAFGTADNQIVLGNASHAAWNVPFLTSNGLLKTSGSNGAISVDTSTFTTKTGSVTDGHLAVWDGTAGALKDGGEAGGDGYTPLKTVRIEAAATDEPATNPAAVSRIVGTNQAPLVVVLPASSSNHRPFEFEVPADVDNDGTVTFRAKGWSATAAADKFIELRFGHWECADSAAWDTAYTTLDSGDLAVDATQGDLDILEWTASVSSLGWVAKSHVFGDLLRIAPAGAELSGDWYWLTFEIDIPREEP